MKKVVFLIHKTSDETYADCVESIRGLKIPPFLNVKQVYWSESYDSKKTASDAYYSLCSEYHPDITIIIEDTVLFVDEHIVFKLVKIFMSDSSIGVIGVKGAERIPDNGNIDDADVIYGGFYEMNFQRDVFSKRYSDVKNDTVSVETISSTMVAVRGNIPMWSNVNQQCMGPALSLAATFQGLKAIVPQNSFSWCFSTVPEQKMSDDDMAFIQRKKKLKDYLMTVDHYLLTVGIPTFNRSRFFKKCIANIYSQVENMPWVEVFVSNNDSTDDTEVIASQYFKYNNFYYFKQPVNILAKNIEYIYDNAHGDYMIACGDDDYYNNGVILDILEAICFGDRPAVMNLTWPAGEIDKTIKYGSGLNNFLPECTSLFTCISCIVLNRRIYSLIEDKHLFTDTQLNQVYVQMEMIRISPQYAIIVGTNFRGDSGEAAVGKVFENKVDFCNIFIRGQYKILDYFLDKGLSQEAYEEEKLKNLDKTLFWLNNIKDKGDYIQWKIDDDLEEIMEEYYGYEPYYKDVRKHLNELLS